MRAGDRGRDLSFHAPPLVRLIAKGSAIGQWWVKVISDRSKLLSVDEHYMTNEDHLRPLSPLERLAEAAE